MKKFSVPCDFNGVKAPFTIYIGLPKDDHHPLHFQADWLSKERGGNIPQEVMDSLAKLKELADKNGVSFEDLCVYALGAAQQEAEEAGEEIPEGKLPPEEESAEEEPEDEYEEGGEEEYEEELVEEEPTEEEPPVKKPPAKKPKKK